MLSVLKECVQLIFLFTFPRNNLGRNASNWKRWLEPAFKDILCKFNPCDIWNADEAGVFYTQISKKNYCQASKKPQGGKLFKHRSSILFAASLIGEKRGPLNIYKGSSLQSDLQKKSDIITTHEKESPNLIQTTLLLSPVQKTPPEE